MDQTQGDDNKIKNRYYATFLHSKHAWNNLHDKVEIKELCGNHTNWI